MTMANTNESHEVQVLLTQSSHFGIDLNTLSSLIDPKNPTLYEKLGQSQGLAKALKTNLDTGLNAPIEENIATSSRKRRPSQPQVQTSPVGNDILLRRSVFGTNALPEPISKSFFQFMWEAVQDRTLIVLIIAAIVEIGIGVYKFGFAPPEKRDSLALVDGGAILVAVLVVVLSASISDYQKQSQFRKLSDFSKSLLEIRVFRNSEIIHIPPDDLVVGDVVLLQVGDVIPADGILVQGFNVEADESTLTGEPFAILKDLTNDPFMLSGTRIVNGLGRMLVIATGVHSLNGRSILALEVEPEETPLQRKLGRIADAISKYGSGLALSMMAILLVVYLTRGPLSEKESFVIGQDIMNLFITAVTIVVVAVPEGLPLAVTLSLAHATVQMLKDNNLVRHLSACETMGNATTICSDKTGTLTLNKMTVVKGQISGITFSLDSIPSSLKKTEVSTSHFQCVLDWITCSLNVNSSAESIKDPKTGESVLTGSKTELALLDFTTKLGFPFAKHRSASQLKVLEVQPFSSKAKSMATYIRYICDSENDILFHKNMGIISPTTVRSDQARHQDWVFVKGASEIVLSRCTRYMDEDGKMQILSAEDRQRLEGIIHEFASDALRTIGAAMKPIWSYETSETNKNEKDSSLEKQDDTASDLVWVGLFGIQDPVRPEVPDAVRRCQQAGIIVRMVTGDNIVTAKAIARECGILSSDGIAMEGPDFRKLSRKEFDDILPKLQVLARSSPLDKQILVKNLKRLGNVVAVTGDGTNDAPALTSADVGFSMGIAGTEVAKEASDIVLMDDNFASLVKAVLWGRAVFDAIRKFLQFQLTVNVSAVIIAIVTAFSSTLRTGTPTSALYSIQLLWINMIMNAVAAFALATDPPAEDLLSRSPAKVSDSIVSPSMFKMMLGQAFYQLIVCLTLYFASPIWFAGKTVAGSQIEYHETVVFNTFLFCQFFNMINSRSINGDIAVFKGILGNVNFIVSLIIITICQAVIVQYSGYAFKVTTGGLDWIGWVVSIGCGLGSFPVGYIIRLLPEFEIPSIPSIRKIRTMFFGGKNVEDSEKTEDHDLGLDEITDSTGHPSHSMKAFTIPVTDFKSDQDARHMKTTHAYGGYGMPIVGTPAAGESSASHLPTTSEIPENVDAILPADPSSSSRHQASSSFGLPGRLRRMDYSTLQLADPSQIRQAKIRAFTRTSTFQSLDTRSSTTRH